MDEVSHSFIELHIGLQITGGPHDMNNKMQINSKCRSKCYFKPLNNVEAIEFRFIRSN